MAKIYYERDANINVLRGKTIGIVGYGSQGHAHAQNLRDSGLKVIVAELYGTVNYRRAKEDGFSVLSADEVSEKADIIMMLVPDPIQPVIYKSSIEKNLKPGKVLGFAHGFNIHYSQIIPPEGVDVIMVAPKGPGHLVRRQYLEGKGVPSLIAIEKDASGKARDIALAYAKGIGAAKAGVIETNFKEETETDLFGEQVVLCGGLTSLIKAGYETLVEAGYQPEMAYFECLHELKLIVDLIQEKGISFMNYSISDTAEYGEYSRGERIITDDTKKEMKKILKEIVSGEFAKEWLLENQVNRPIFNQKRKEMNEHLIEKVGKKLRDMMVWLRKK